MTQHDAPVLTVPAYRGELRKLSGTRRRGFMRHLRNIIREAAKGTAVSPPAEPALPAAVRAAASAACAACGGHCCSRGGEHAYLDDATIRRVAGARPGVTPRAMARIYRDYLPETSFAGSCVFHAVQGCTLPRELRADLCNSFYCNPLKRFIQNYSGSVPARIRIESTEGAERNTV